VSPSSRLVFGSVMLALLAVALTAYGRTSPSPAAPPSLAASPSPLSASGLDQPTPGSPPAAGESRGAVGSVGPSVVATTTPTSRPTPRPTATSAACRPTDQDRYVYNPDRLEVAKACVYVTGVVAALRREADGDLHILVDLDAAYVHLLRPANQGEELGDLVVEPVCVKSVTQTDAIDSCAADPDPLAPPYPAVGERVWMEGRYVFDLDHGGWAELHPLYRWGLR
jgi:hypothetical protein